MTSPLRTAALLAAIAAVGNLLLAIAHLGIEIPVLSALGPQGGAVPPAVVAFTVGTLLFGAIALGLVRARRWAWTAGLIVCGMAVLSGIGQFRGAVSAVGIVLSLGIIVLLLLPSSRQSISASA